MSASLLHYAALFIIHIFLIGPILSGPTSCPKLPEQCSCKINRELMSVSCRNVSISRLAQSIGTIAVDEVKLAECDEKNIDSLPFNGVRSLEINNCSVETISAGAWKRMEKSLETLSLADNKLKSVPDFGNISSLLALNLNNNEISSVNEKAFANLNALTQLRIEGNQICDLPPKALDATKSSLVLLDVSDNCLQTVPAQILRNANGLMYLDLSSNNISEVNNFELMNLVSLRELRLQNNTLRRIHPMAFMNVPQLQYLYLQDNLISTLDGNRLQAFKKLEILDVSNNVLQTLPSLKDLPNLRQVKVDGNLITKVETLAFSNNPRLQLISLQNNNLVQISRNAFDALDQLVVLLLGNNSLANIERGMLDGMRNLQQLSIRNNTLTSLNKNSFASLTQLTTLDLAHNKISEIEAATFDYQTKLFWLDLSNNDLSGFRRGVFTKKIANILLDGNHLMCDESFNDVLTYLVTNRVRTFLPFQPEITCSGPNRYEGVRLKDLMIRKANDTLTDLGLSNQAGQRSILSSFLPSLGPLGNMGNLGQSAGALPILHSITQSIPSLRAIPGFGGAMPAPSVRGAQPLPNKNLNDAIEQFTAPLVRFATGGQPVASDIEQLIHSIPNFVVNVPGFGDVDLSKMDPQLISYVLKGGVLPGLDKATTEGIVKQAMQKMHAAAQAAMQGNPLPDQEKHLPPLDRLPSELVTQAIKGDSLPGLNETETKVIMDYYTQQIPSRPSSSSSSADQGSGSGEPPKMTFSPQMFEMLKMLPPGYNLNKIPAEVIQAISRGEVPDMRLLPADLLEHLKSHTNSIANMFSQVASKNVSIDEILEKLPVFARPEMSTFMPYDINELTSEMVLEREVEERHRRIRLYTAIALALVGVITLIVIAFFVNYFRKQRSTKQGLMMGNSSSSSSSADRMFNAVPPPPPPRSSPHNISHNISPSVVAQHHTAPLADASMSRLHNSIGFPQFSSTLLDSPVRPPPGPVPTPRRLFES